MDSVLSGKPDNVEYIVVDGNSTDGSIDIIRKYEKHLDCLIVEEDAGQSDAILKGFRNSSGCWFNWLNSDDYLEPNILKTLSKELSSQHTNANIVSGNTTIVNRQRQCIGRLEAVASASVFDILLNAAPFVAPQPSTFIRRNVFWLRRSLHFVMDWALYLEILDVHPGSMCKIDLDIANFRVHEESKTSTRSNSFSLEAKHFLSNKRFLCPKNNIARKSYLKRMEKYEISRRIQESDSLTRSVLFTLQKDPSLFLDRAVLSAFRRLLSLRDDKSFE